MRKIIILLVLFISSAIQAQGWTQVGADIDGTSANDKLGTSVSLSSDGTIVAISGQSYVRVLKNVGGTWTQVGSDISAVGSWVGLPVSLSSDGDIIAIGITSASSGTGKVQIYKNIGGTWTQIGSDINGGRSGEMLGTSISLSSDGSIVAIGAIEDGFHGNGHVGIYKNIGGTWTQIGSDINGEAAGDWFGWSVSLSSDGKIVAIGGPSNGGTGINAGHVRVYKDTGGTWTQVGADIDGEAEGDRSGEAVSLSSDGSIVAIGAPNNDANGSTSGQVRVYKNTGGTWTQVGADIDGDGADNYLGKSVSLSSDGSVVTIGAPGLGVSLVAGYVRVYENTGGTWTQVGADINAEATDDSFGRSVSSSSNGAIVAIGAPYNDGGGTDSGHVRVYKNNALSISELKEAGISIYPNPSTGVFSIKNADNYDISIMDITGKIIYKNSDITNGHIHLQSSGIYIINFKSETKNFSSKIIIK